MQIVALGLEQVFASFQIRQRHVVVGATAGAVGKGLGHEARESAMFAGNLVGHHPEEHQAVGHGQCVGIFEVGFELAVGVFVIKRVHIPAQLVHGVYQLIHDGQVIHERAGVITGLAQVVAITQRGKAAILGIPEQEELGFNTEIEAIPHIGRRTQLTT